MGYIGKIGMKETDKEILLTWIRACKQAVQRRLRMDSCLQ